METAQLPLHISSLGFGGFMLLFLAVGGGNKPFSTLWISVAGHSSQRGVLHGPEPQMTDSKPHQPS